MMRSSSSSLNGILSALLLEPTGGLMSGLIGVSEIHFRLTAKRKKARRTPRRVPFRPRTELEARVEQVGVGRRELVDHHVAATVGVCRQLFRERPILAEGRGGDLRALAIREEDAGGLRDGDAGRSRRARPVRGTAGAG